MIASFKTMQTTPYPHKCKIQFVALLMLFIFAKGHAQTPKGTRIFRTLCYFPVEDLQTAHYIVRGKAEEVELPKMNLSRSYEVPDDGQVIFGTPALKDGESVIIPIARARIPAEFKESLLLFFPATTNDSGIKYEIKVLNYDVKLFPPGSYLFINASDDDVAGMFGTEKLMIPARRQVFFTAPSALMNDERYYVNIRTRIDGQWRPLYKSYWRKDTKKRKLGLIYRDPVTARLRLLCFPYRTDPLDIHEQRKERNAYHSE
jgi:hypothetical protein